MCENSERWVFRLDRDFEWTSPLEVLYQFLLDGLPFSRRQADACFLALLRETGFTLRGLYWLAVRLFGGLIVALHRYKRQNRGTRHLAPAATS